MFLPLPALRFIDGNYSHFRSLAVQSVFDHMDQMLASNAPTLVITAIVDILCNCIRSNKSVIVIYNRIKLLQIVSNNNIQNAPILTDMSNRVSVAIGVALTYRFYEALAGAILRIGVCIFPVCNDCNSPQAF